MQGEDWGFTVVHFCRSDGMNRSSFSWLFANVTLFRAQKALKDLSNRLQVGGVFG